MAIIYIVNLWNPDPCINWQHIDDNNVVVYSDSRPVHLRNYYFKP